MRVKTFLGAQFDDLCKRLADEVLNHNFSPDIVVGILTGGGYVGREVRKAWPSAIYTEIRVQRRDTAKKGSGFRHKLLQLLPYCLLNRLRMAEMLYEDLKARKTKPRREGNVELPDDIDALLTARESHILLVDDAIDTGATLKLIKDHINSTYPLANVKIAVITVTSNHPLIDADFCLYHDRTLVRFPWSNDVKQKK